MNSNDVFLSITIITLFGILFVSSVLESRRKTIRDNWDEMKCNPSVMPFASTYGPINGEEISTIGNFKDCMSKMQSASLFDFLGPVYSMLDGLSEFTGAIQSELINIKAFLNTLVSMINDTFSIFFIIIANMTAGIYKILANMKDTTERIVVVNHVLKGLLDQSHAYLMAINNYSNNPT